MGVRVIESCESSGDEDCSCCNSTTTSTSSNTKYIPTVNIATTAKPATSCKPQPQRNRSAQTELETENVRPTNFKMASKDLIGNCKEFRIDHNKSDLRIIGNGNRIRIHNNTGHLNIIGNTTRLKITQNSGNIKYTGNDGRIYLGSESTQQLVDYIGCNGILKIINMFESAEKCKNKYQTDKSTTEGKSKQYKPKKVRAKSASYGGNGDCTSAQWQKFSELFQRSSVHNSKGLNVSLPDLLPPPDCSCSCKCRPAKVNKTKTCNINNNVNIVHTIGNIVIKNAVNVSL